jgi:hypothetical protein
MPANMPGKILSGTAWGANYDWLLSTPGTYEVKTVSIDAAISDGTDTAGIVASGLVLGIITAAGQFKQYDDAAMDGTQVAAAILLHPIKKTDDFGNAIAEPIMAAVVLRARVDGSKLIGLDANGKADLKAQGFLFDDDLP